MILLYYDVHHILQKNNKYTFLYTLYWAYQIGQCKLIGICNYLSLLLFYPFGGIQYLYQHLSILHCCRMVAEIGTQWPFTIASRSWNGQCSWTSWSQIVHKCLLPWHSWHLTMAALSVHLWHMTFSGTAKLAWSKVLKFSERGLAQLSFNVCHLSDQFCFLGGPLSCILAISFWTSSKSSFISFQIKEKFVFH